MFPLLPAPGESHNLDDIEKETPFVTYAWSPPLCPWCGNWLRKVNMRPVGIPFVVRMACPSYHGLYAFNQTRWVDFRPAAIQRGGDGAWWTTLDTHQLWAMSQLG